MQNHSKIQNKTLENHCFIDVRGHLLNVRGCKASDKIAHVAKWCWEGAPGGVQGDFVLYEIYPEIDDADEEILGFHTLDIGFETFTNLGDSDNKHDAVEENLKFW